MSTTVATQQTENLNPWLKLSQSMLNPHGEPVTPMRVLYAEMLGIYQSRWKRNFTTKESMKLWAHQWSDAFVKHGITPHDVQKAIETCRVNLDWPPSLPEFLGLCRPNPEAAFYEAVNGLVERQKGNKGVWTHKAIFWAASMIGSDLLCSNYAAIKTRWAHALNSTLALGAWADIPDPAPALPPPGQNITDSETALGNMEKVREAASSFLPAVGNKEWAKKILANPDGRPLDVVDMARRALGVAK